MKPHRDQGSMVWRIAFAVLLMLQLTLALMPPHPDFTEWESVHQLRRRLNITWNYEPVHLSHEHCRHLSEEECRLEDEGLGDAKLHRNGRHLSPSTGIVRILVLLIKFPEYDESVMGPLPPVEYYDELFNGNGRSNRLPVGSLKEYFRFGSLGKYRVQFDVRGWFEADSNESVYAGGNYGLNGQIQMQKVFYSAMDEVDKSGINYFDGYINEWGLFNHLVALHSGFSAELGPLSCIKAKPVDRIWSQGSASSQTGYMTRDYYQVNGYALTSAFGEPKCDGSKIVSVAPAGLGIVAHEYLHGFALKDMYDQDSDEGSIPVGGTGRFDIMSNSLGWDRNVLIPGHMSAFSRLSTPGWLEPIAITRNGFYAIQPSEISGHIYKISHNFPEGEYLLIENRQPIKFDANWPQQCGIVIYHVDEKVGNQGRRGYPGKAGWPQDHYMVSILQADGNYDIEKGNNIGDEGDFWRSGDVLGPGPNVWPNTDSIQGKQYQTNIKITIQSNPGFIMTFRVDGINGVSRADGTGDDVPVADNMDEVGELLSWILSLLGGVAAMLGVMVMVL